MTLDRFLLTYVGYCLPQAGYRVRHADLQAALKKACRKTASVTTLRKQLSILKKRGLITTRPRYSKAVLTLSQEGKLAIAPRLSYRSYGYWDGRWRVVITTIPEVDRKYRLKLFAKLEELGFRKFREGVYITPNQVLGPVKYLVTHFGLNRYVIMLETDEVVQERSMVLNIWQLDEVNDRYAAFLKRSRIGRGIDWPIRAKLMEEMFEDVYRDDPHLPPELLPKDWYATAAYERYKKITRSY